MQGFLDIEFLFKVLPIILIIAFIPKEKIKTVLLVVASFVVYYLIDAKHILLFALLVVSNVICGRVIHKTETKGAKKMLLCSGVGVNVVVLCFFKYGPVLSNSFHIQYNYLMPLGISYFIFKAISYLVDLYTGKATIEKNPLYDVLYLSFWGHIQNGPMVRYEAMKKKESTLQSKTQALQIMSEGIMRFLTGVGKKVILADMLGNVVNEIFATPITEMSPLFAWLGGITYSLQLYYDFSGYSDIAIGLTKIFGYECTENFDYPYMTESISRFWRRWHISLSQWFRDYVYIPLGGSRSSNKYQVYASLFITWFLTGIWHGSSLNFVAWGLGYFVMISFERGTRIPERLQSDVAKIVYRLFSLMVIMIGWIVFRAPDMSYGWGYICSLFGKHPYVLNDYRALILFLDYKVYYFMAVLFCMPIVPKLEAYLAGNKRAYPVYKCCKFCVLCILFVIAVSFVFSGQYKPFVYANF